MPDVAEAIKVSTHKNVMEQQRTISSTYNNINKWFKTLKSNLVEYKFAWVATEVDGDVADVGELIFYEGQLDRILKVDESEVSTDGTSKLSGGRPITEYGSNDPNIAPGVTAANKSSYCATFIGGSTMAGDPVPPHFQMVSKAKEENRRVEGVFLKDMMKVRGKYGHNLVQLLGVLVGSNEKWGMDDIEFKKYIKI